MPVDWSISKGDILANINGSTDLVVIFGSAMGGWDYSGLIKNATKCDVIGIRDQKMSWFEDAGESFRSLDDIDDYLSGMISTYQGRKILCGISMGGTAALYFGSAHKDADIIVGSPQIFQYQFLWDQTLRPHYKIIERLPAKLRARATEKIEVIVCGDGDDPNWNWRDNHAAALAHDVFGLPVTRLPGAKHACWELFSMRSLIEARLGYSLFDADGEGR